MADQYTPSAKRNSRIEAAISSACRLAKCSPSACLRKEAMCPSARRFSTITVLKSTSLTQKKLRMHNSASKLQAVFSSTSLARVALLHEEPVVREERRIDGLEECLVGIPAMHFPRRVGDYRRLGEGARPLPAPAEQVEDAG